MSRPTPTRIYHFTDVKNLPGILESGLSSDAQCRRTGLTAVEVGSQGIRERRLTLPVPIPPGGNVGDYVPFYFAPRSPMLFTLTRGNHGFTGDVNNLLYLVSSLETLEGLEIPWIVSDRNAALAMAAFVDSQGDLDSHIDWPLMAQRNWSKSLEDPERPDRRMAECLVWDRVPVNAISRIVAKTAAVASAAGEILATKNVQINIDVSREWYF